jgi:hypothetical protein
VVRRGRRRVYEKVDGETDAQFIDPELVSVHEMCGDHIVEQHVHNLDVANWFIAGRRSSPSGSAAAPGGSRGTGTLLQRRLRLWRRRGHPQHEPPGQRLLPAHKRARSSARTVPCGPAASSTPPGQGAIKPKGGVNPYVQEHVD